jgi:hypothetical protein
MEVQFNPIATFSGTSRRKERTRRIAVHRLPALGHLELRIGMAGIWRGHVKPAQIRSIVPGQYMNTRADEIPPLVELSPEVSPGQGMATP